MHQAMQHSVLVCFILGPALEGIADACGRKPPTPPPTTITPTESTIYYPLGHEMNCTEAESNITACLNDGTCFAILLQGSREVRCMCPAKYRGKRCQDPNLDYYNPDPSVESVRNAGIAGGIAALIIAVIFVIGIAYVVHRKYRRRQSTRQLKNSNGIRSHNATIVEETPINAQPQGLHEDPEYINSNHIHLSLPDELKPMNPEKETNV